MINRETCKKAWVLLDVHERRNAWITLIFVVLGALSSALMVGSILPFLSVLSDSDQIERLPALAWTYKKFGFSDSYTFLVFLGFASFSMIIVTCILQILLTYVLARFTMMRIHSISYRLLIAYLQQPYTFFLNRHSGEMSTLVLQEAQQMVTMFLRPVADLIASTMTVIMIVGLLLFLNPMVTIFAFAVFGGSYVIIYVFSRRALKNYGRDRAFSNSERSRIVNEALGGIKDIKLLGRERSYANRYGVPSYNMARSLVSIQVYSQIPQFAMQAVAFGGMILFCLILMNPEAFKAGEALGGMLPTLGVFAFAGQRLMPELSKLYVSLAQIQAGGAAVDIVYDDLINKSKLGSLPYKIPQALGLNKCLEFVDVSFRYPKAELAGLKQISFKIQVGERIGIVGSTGAGKTTLADLILGLLQPSEGQINADGIFINNSNLRAWQQSVGYVPQDIFLTDASISENIALGVPVQEIDEKRVHRAAEIARIHTFITEELTDGYLTEIGERGVRLSGGQRQRVGIARALYHEADLIVFDEATSALDNLTEREVMTAIDSLPGDKTVLMIAHRLSTVKRCDRIIVLDKGKLVGFDTWDALMSNNTSFRKIANLDTML
ncbi:ABC transporter ATP-binding protein/permease [Amylibacter sp.]|nr:ABC transporter ATP-binding protein/permease [Amylibacter sp.]